MPTADSPIRYVAHTWPPMFVAQPELGHMKEISRTLASEAAFSGRVALLPPLQSNRDPNRHRPGRLRWSDYFDWAHLPLIDPACREPDELRETLRHAWAHASKPDTTVSASAPCVSCGRERNRRMRARWVRLKQRIRRVLRGLIDENWLRHALGSA